MLRPKKDIIGRCGYKCGLCLAYRENIKSDADRKRFRDGLLKYYRYRLSLQDCYCDGCLADDRKNPTLLTPNCRVRPCVVKRRLDNCASCDRYPCRTLEKKFIDGKQVVKKYDAPIPKKDYDRFVGPYENKKRLDAIRKKLKGGPDLRRRERTSRSVSGTSKVRST
ncbi:MAG: DUF3795 domain-containing protein [Candidatus Aminicenantes bacterium]|nr:DUF3795 domain-containing protein [Candidatus Aminicenantes bacterium]